MAPDADKIPYHDPTGINGVRPPYVHPLTPRLNAELQSRGFPTTRRERRKALRRLKRLLEKQRTRDTSESS